MDFIVFLWYGEFIWNIGSSDFYRFYLSHKYIVFQSNGSIILILFISKIDQFHVDIEIYLAQSSLSSFCSITALRILFHHYSILSHVSLFIKSFNQSFDKLFFIHIIYHLLLNVDISIIDYLRYFLWKNIIIIVDRNDISRLDIKFLRYWKNDIMDVYINKHQKSDHIRKILYLNVQFLSSLH